MKYIIANQKMKLTLQQVNTWITEFDNLVQSKNYDENKIMVIISPSYVFIPLFAKLSEKYSFVKICAQDVYDQLSGSYTGKVSITQVKDFCEYSIIGHTETKNNTDQKIQKTNLCLQNSVKPIICSDNPIQELEEFFSNNIDNNDFIDNVLVAYEDPTNISKNGVYNEKPIDQVQKDIRLISDNFKNINIIYGGSINENNVDKIANIQELSGVLVGNASLTAQSFVKIIDAYSNL